LAVLACNFICRAVFWRQIEHGDLNMDAGFIHVNLNGLERRPILVAIMMYWVALGVAGLILMLAFAVSRGPGAHPPYLAGRGESFVPCYDLRGLANHEERST
jgi:hypothetical protein